MHRGAMNRVRSEEAALSRCPECRGKPGPWFVPQCGRRHGAAAAGIQGVCTRGSGRWPALRASLEAHGPPDSWPDPLPGLPGAPVAPGRPLRPARPAPGRIVRALLVRPGSAARGALPALRAAARGGLSGTGGLGARGRAVGLPGRPTGPGRAPGAGHQARRTGLDGGPPTSPQRRWSRGFDLAEEAAAGFARRLGKPFRRLLSRAWFSPAQAGQSESGRRRLPAAAVRPRRGCRLHGETVLVVDDVWTTGTTLLRCAQALARAGAGELAVLALFRAMP